jgi:hypothetical protein
MSDAVVNTVLVKPVWEDFSALQQEVVRGPRATFRYKFVTWLSIAVFAGVLAAAVEFFVVSRHMPAWLAVLLWYLPAALVFSAVGQALQPLLLPAYLDPKGTFLSGFEAHAERDGLRLKGDWGETYYRWKAVLGVKETQTHLFVYLDRLTAVLIPKRGFASRADAKGFADFIRKQSAASLSNR